MGRKVFVLLGFFFLQRQAVAAGQPVQYLKINPEVEIGELAPISVRSDHGGEIGSKIQLVTRLKGNVVSSDASMLLEGANYDQLLKQSRDFGHYKQMRMPNLIDSKVVIPPSESGRTFVTWAHMTESIAWVDRVSKHFLLVELTPGPNSHGGEGQTWIDYHPNASERAQYQITLEDSSMFNDLEGAWYSQRLANGKIYCRYVLRGDIKGGIPARGIGGAGVAMRRFGAGVRMVMQRLVELQQTRRE
jgi:hypothetical protein